jgi:hypothetical protein
MAVWGGINGGVAWTYFHADITQAVWDEYLGLMEALVAQDLPSLSLILFARQSDTPNAAMRRQIGEFMKSQKHLLKKVQANAMVLDSPLARGTLTAINWLIQKPFPEKTFKDGHAAMAWLAEHDANVDVDELVAGMQTHVPSRRLLI